MIAEVHVRALQRLLAALTLLAVFAVPALATEEIKRTGGPYVPTPQVVVDSMLQMARVGAGDFVVDLGSGDGVIVLTAATRFKASGFGVDIDPELVELSNRKAKTLGVAERARFMVEDVFKADLSRASVLTLYLLPGMMIDLRPKIFRELASGTRIVSHDYHFGDDWLCDDQISFDVPEKEMVNGVPSATVRLWVVPAKIAGNWQLKMAAGSGTENYELVLHQRYNKIEGSVAGGSTKNARLANTLLRGDDFAFSAPLEGRTLATRFAGKVKGDTMEGVVELPNKGPVRFTATRVSAAPVATP